MTCDSVTSSSLGVVWAAPDASLSNGAIISYTIAYDKVSNNIAGKCFIHLKTCIKCQSKDELTRHL